MKHQMQHPDSPTWCTNCGDFDFACEDSPECDGDGAGRFNSEKPANFDRMLRGIFGEPATPEAG